MASVPTTQPEETAQNFNPKEPFVGLYTMYFRPNGTNMIVSKNFRHSGNLRSARDRAEQNCNVLGNKLNFVQPLISDLQKEEDFKLGIIGVTTSLEEVKK